MSHYIEPQYIEAAGKKLGISNPFVLINTGTLVGRCIRAFARQIKNRHNKTQRIDFKRLQAGDID